MKTLTKLAAPALAATLALSAAMPAQAHDAGPAFHKGAPASRYVKEFRPHPMPGKRFGHFGIRAEIADLQRDIDKAAAMHRISWREARSLRIDAQRLERMYWSYARGGLTRKELARLDYRIGKLRMALRHEKRDRNHRRG
jgi:hypothetical protein